MPLPKVTGLAAAALVAAASLWIYSLTRSFDEMDSLMQWVPADTGVPHAKLEPESARMTATIVAPAATDPADSDSAHAELDAPPPPRAPATVPAVSDTPPAQQIVTTSDPSSFAGEEFPYQRNFDPYLYEQVVEEHYANQPQWRLPPGVETREELATEPDIDPAADPRRQAALHD